MIPSTPSPIATLLFLSILILFPAPASAQELAGKGFFRASETNGVWWLVDPEGQPFLSKGVNHVSWMADRIPASGRHPYNEAVRKIDADEAAWAKRITARLKGWGFNTIGAWSSPSTYAHMAAYTPVLNIGTSAGGDWQSGGFPDVFTDRFERVADRIARERCAPRKNDRRLLGWFSDNELRWGADWRTEEGLLATFLAMDRDAPGRRAAMKFLRERYPSLARLEQALGLRTPRGWRFDQIGRLTDISPSVVVAQTVIRYSKVQREPSLEDAVQALTKHYGSMEQARKRTGTRAKTFEDFARAIPYQEVTRELAATESAFTGVIAERYFSVVRRAILRHDPHHMILGCRFAGYAPPEVVAAAGRHVDVLTYNSYGREAPAGTIREFHRLSGRPIMLTEFSFKAEDSGLPNSRGAGSPVPTQEDRAKLYTSYVQGLYRLPMVVGHHWFEHADQPAEGRFDGENNNFGVVRIDDSPWKVLTEQMTRVHAGLADLHRASR